MQHDAKIKVLFTIITALLFPNLRLFIIYLLFARYFPMIFLLRFSEEVFENVAPDLSLCTAAPTTSMTRFYTFSCTVLFEFLVKFSALFA